MSKEIKNPILPESSTEYDQYGQDNHEAEENFGEVVELGVSFAHFLTGIMRIHYTSHFPSRINNNTDGLPTCQKAVAPKRIIEVQWFPDAVVLSTRFNFEHSFEVVNIQLRCLRLHCCLQTD